MTVSSYNETTKEAVIYAIKGDYTLFKGELDTFESMKRVESAIRCGERIAASQAVTKFKRIVRELELDDE